ncbi:hypothetical protein FOFC_14379 [Fusarium oxysporum]|nr:hypothetical protein FOFC_14379 [Fusarium oxysporum]
MCKNFITTTICRKCGHCVNIEFDDKFCDDFKKKGKECRREVEHKQKGADPSKCSECKQRRMSLEKEKGFKWES